MDILSYTTVLRNFNSDDLLPDLRAFNHEISEVTPTKFMSEMELSTEQRHERLIKLFYKKKTCNKGTIDIVPSIIIFQNYQEGTAYTVPLTVINTGKTSCYMKLLFQYSPYFSVIHDDKLIPPKLAPGMEINFLVQFIPEENRDYWHQVKILTNNEEYTVSLIAIGTRPLLNLPDNILLPDSPVKIESEKYIIVKNTGLVSAVFNIHTKPPFSVTPLKGILESNETTQFLVKFKPNDEGAYNENITVNYETGEKLVMNVQATAICTNVFLNKRKLQFEDTYIGLQCHRTIELINKSNHVVHFAWKQFDSSELDKMDGDKMKESFNTIRDYESKKTTKLETYDVIDSETNEIIYDRIYKDEITEFDKSDQFLFYHPDFSVLPQTGDIGANHSTDITVMFSPNHVQAFETVAYCDVSGRVERLPLKLAGVGVGPKFTLNLDSLDMNNVFLYTDHCFEVVVCNDGDIAGKLSYVPREYDFGIHISCEPNTLQLKPFEHGAFDLQFHCSNEGPFIEEIHFSVEHSEEIIKLLIKGKVLYPLLTVNISNINFGYISLGFPVIKPVTLFNNTPIEIPFEAYIYPDGSDRATVLNSSNCIGKLDPADNPKEYEINPSSGVVPPNSSLTLKLTLVANICRIHTTTLFIETWNTTKHRLTFQLKHNGRIPELLCTPSDINIRFCFLDYLCHRLIVIKNKSSFIGYMHLYGEKQDGLNVRTDVTEFRIEPYGITEISLNIICTKLGLQSTVLKLHLFGGQPMVICKITCIGQGPVLSVIPEHLHFGQVKLLKDTCKIVSIYNDSPIGAAVTLQVNENSPWTIEPTEAYLEPEESRDINVCVYLNNTKKYKGSIFIDVCNRGVIECNLTATGVGTCIQVTPPITPVLDLGAQLTKHMIKEQLVFANKGVRHHKILIASQREIKSFQQYNVEDNPTLFSFIPNFFSLCPDENITVTLSIQNERVQRIEENFYIHAIIDNKVKKQIIMETTVMANFVEPILAFSKKEMTFRMDFDVDTIKKALTDVLEIKNNTPLVLEIDLQVQHPFYIELNGSQLLHHILKLHIDETYYLTIFFDSSAESKHCFVVRKNLEITYRGHPRKDYISLKGEVNYPNIQFNPELVDFGAVTDNSQSQRMVELKNISPLPVSYYFEWLEDEIFMNNMPPVEKLPALELKESLTDYSVSSQPTEEIPSEHEHLPIVSAKSTKKQEKGKKEKPPKSSKGKKPRAPSVNRKSKNCLPVEIIFQQYAIETVKYPEQIQIYQELHEAVSTTRLMDLPEGNRENLQHLKQMLYPFVETYATNKPDASIFQCLNTAAPRVSEISRIIEIIPSRGYLEPFESQFLSLSYRTVVNTSVKARVLCHVHGGPTESLDIVGMASDISYYLNRTSVDFGRQVFCEVSQKSIKLVNTGYIPFTFTTTAKEPTEAQSARLLEVGWFTVQPQNGTVFAQSEMELLVRYYPGIAGKFSESFQLEIGHLAPVTIAVSGYGVFSQVHLNLPRPSMSKVPVCTCYTAIANITPDYLMFVENIKVWTHPEGEVHVNDMSKEEKRELQKDGWVVISYSNKYPSAMDIDLAIERMLAYEYITQHPEILADHSLSTGLKFIPRFYTPAYLIDFGYVVTDTMVHYTVLILNYGSTSCKVRVVPNLRKSGFLRAGFNIQYKGAGILVGDTEALYVIFCPTPEVYPTRRQSVKFRISLEVEHGPRIPITVKAIVTVPFIETSTDHLDFDQVICGQRKMMNFFIINTGYVPCTWEAKIEKISKTKPPKCQNPKNCTFNLTTEMGYLEPGEKILLDVYFEPRKNGHFEWKLQISLDQNPEEFTVLLNGDGVKPWLKINEQNLEFVPSLHYSNESVQSFTIENPCSFPIEFYLSEFDEQILEEETIIRLLSQYYAANAVYIPQRLAGEKLPQALYNFYDDLLNELRSSLTVNEKDETFSQATNITAKTKKIKKRRGSSAISSLENIRTGLDPLENKSTDEIESLLKELLANKLQHNIENTGANLVQDPVETSFKQLTPAPLELDSSTVKEGILIVFHGAPYTESVYAANSVAKKLNLPVSNINHMILEALAYNENVNCTRINEIINHAYSQATDTDVQIVDETEDTDPYKQLERKIQFLISQDGRKKHSSAKGSAKSSKSGKSGATADSKKTKANPGVDSVETLLGISQELLIEVLREKLNQYKLGIVIESLDNIFIRTPILTLMCLLKAVGNLKYIHCFLLYNSMQAYQSIINNEREAEQVLMEQKKNEMLEHFDSITEEEFDNLSPDYLELYKNTYLTKRKEERQRRLEGIRKKSAPMVSIKVSQRKKTDLSTKISIITEKGKKDRSSAKKSDKSSASSKKTKKTVKLSPEMQKISKEFDSFLAEYRHMLHIHEFWDRKASLLIKDYTEHTSKKTEKPTKKNKKDSKPPSAVTAITIESETTIGVPVWIINSTNNESQMIDIISMVMHDYIEYQTAREGVIQSLIVKLEPSVEVHSILKQPVAKRNRTLSQVFSITTSNNTRSDSELNIPDNTETNVIENTEDKTDTNIYKGQDIEQVNDSTSKLRKSKTKKRPSLVSKHTQNPTEPAVLIKRLLLQPGAVIKYRIRFSPKTIGCYEHSYGIEIVGWDTQYTINCKAHCDIPKIDMNPKTLFTNVVKEKNPHNEYRRNMFIKNTGIFEFGNLFLCNHHGKHSDRPRKNKATIHIKNISLVLCDIATHLLEDTGVFQQAEDHLIVDPQSVHNLTLTACPAVLGSNSNILALSLKHNPRIELVPLNCTGCKVEFEILNKKLVFERVLLGHKEQRVVTFINYSMVPIHWEFTNSEMFTDKFHIVPLYGDIRENDCIDITIDYSASEVDVMPAKKLYIKIFEENNEDEPLLTEFIEISAETRDILVDCVKSINFGEVKARKNHTLKYDFLNNGKYNILFEISELSEEEVDKTILSIMKMFKISHLNGTLQPGKEFNTIITFNSQKMIDIKDYPIFKCNLMDHISRNILSTFYITATVKTFYSLFEVYPTSEINFGAMLVGTRYSQKLTITNVGRFPFDYTVTCKRRMSTVTIKDAGKKGKKGTKGNSKKSARKSGGSAKSKDSKKSAESKKSTQSKKPGSQKSEGSKKTGSKKSGSKKSGSKKSGKPSKTSIVSKKIKGMLDNLKKKEIKLGPPISCGTFEIKNAKGTIKPEESAELEVECTIMDVGSKEEKIVIFVSESAPKDADGRIITLSAIGCIPSINLNDYTSIFKKHFIVEREDDFVKPKELENHCVFVTEEEKLVFNNVCINTTSSAQIQVYNNSLVEAELTLKSTLASVFAVNPAKLYIPSYTHGQLTITFTPIAIEAYKANLELHLALPEGQKPEMKTFHLFGEGRVPEISLIKPESMDRNNNYIVIYEPTLVDKCTMKAISFVNSGDFPCKVICEICDDNDNVFSINVMSSHSDKLKLIPNETADVNIIYHPSKVALNKCKVQLHIVNNPFEIFTIKITGTAYSEDIILEDIPTCTLMDNNRMSSISLISDVNNTSYILNFDNVNMNSLEKKKFKILNRSVSDIYKFVFKTAVQEVSFIPAVGHVRPEAYKEIIVTFLTDSPVTYDKIVMECTASKIQYTENVDNTLSWDERHKLLIWNDTNENTPEMVLDINEEPPYTVVDGHVKKIQILLSAKADYATYECAISDVLFKDTMMFEKRTYTFTIFNTSSMNLEINWNIVLDNSIRPTSAAVRKISRENVVNRRPETARSSIRSQRIFQQEFTRPRPLTGQERFIEQCKSEFSLTSTSTTRSTSSDSFYMPFTINPEHIVIPARQKYEMTVVFAPLDVYNYTARLKGHITNLSTAQKHIDIGLVAKSVMPYCYFEVRLSDYITSGRRTVDKCDDILDVDTKVVEFDCLGVGISHEKSFNIINPTEDDLIFSWEQLKSSEISSVPIFSCAQSSGIITRGKMVKATFTILPQNTGTFEALYNFKLQSHNFTSPFLFVANIREPKIYFLQSYLNIKPTVYGINVCDYITLKNEENIDLNFKFRKSSLFSESRKECLTLEPRTGIVSKLGETQIKICFKPTEVGEENFTLKCNVDFCKLPLVLGVQTVCYKLEPMVSYMVTSGNRILLTSDTENVINLGTLSPNQTETITFYIMNIGKTGFYYTWKLSNEHLEKKLNLSVTDKEGYVKKDTEINTMLKITSGSSTALKNYQIELKIKYGPKYKIFLNASSTNAAYKFSFFDYDFGPCLIQNSSICYNHKTLEFCNNSLTPLTLENTFNNTEYLSIDFEARQIMPKTKEHIHICFHPRKCQKYNVEVRFLVNCQPVKIKLQGVGVDMNICLLNTEDKYIQLGAPEIGQQVTRTVQVFNRSVTDVQAYFDLWHRLPIVTNPVTAVTHYLKIPTKERIIQDEIEEKTKTDGKKGKKNDKGTKGTKTNKKSAGSKKSDKSSKKSDKSTKSKKSKKSEKSSKSSKKTMKETEFIEIIHEPPSVEDTERQLLSSMITITPKGPIKIAPNKMAEFVINYLPTKRLEPFSEKISVQVHETVKPLCIIEGRSLASDFRLDRNTISFGVAVLHCHRESKLTLINNGDIGSRFSWNYEKTREFSITPIIGYSGAGTSMVFNIIFCPSQIGVQSKCRMECDIKGYKKKLYVDLIGMCCDLPSPLAYINFKCPVRNEDKKTLLIQNSSGQDWKLSPIISGDYFTTNNDILQVPAKSSTTCEILYKPLLMTKKDPHTGSIFFKIPDGKAILYNFEGTADPPAAIKIITLTVPCKTKHNEVLMVTNWSRNKQQFKVYTEDITPGDAINLYETKGQDFIDILGNSKREYNWFFYAYKECSLEFRIIFMNDMKEYMFYKLSITVTKCKPLETITLTTCARTPVTHELTLINPLTDPIVYKLTSTSPALTFKSPVTVDPYSEISTVIEYNPLLVENSKVILEATCSELGTYPYECELCAHEAVSEPELKFTAVLGDVVVLNATAKNLTKSKASFVCKTDDENSFTVDKLLTITANQTSNVPVTFTPYKLGNIKGNLTISSPTAGDFIFPLFGICQSPKPKGPLILKPDTTVVIDFYNPFLTDITFIINVKPNIFTVKANEEFIKSKTNVKIAVKMVDKVSKFNSDVSGKLLITPKDKSLGDVKWIYYLQGCVN